MKSIIIRSTLKEVVGTMSISKDYAEALDEKVHALIKESMQRAQKNNRNTVMPRDL